MEQLKSLVSQLKSISEHYQKPGAGFPYATDSIKTNIGLLVEQAEKILVCETHSVIKIGGLSPTREDVDCLVNRFIADAHQYLTQQKFDAAYFPTYAQSIIPPKALFEVTRAKLFKRSYESVELHHQQLAFEEFCAPFSIRLATEAKLRSMFGFKSAERKNKNGQWEKTDEFKVSLFLDFLKRDTDFFRLPIFPSEIANIYRWACRFTHTGQKEYCWTILKALDRLTPLFDYTLSKKFRTGDCYVYLKKNRRLADLQKILNSSTRFEKYQVELSKDEFEMVDCYYDKRTEKYV